MTQEGETPEMLTSEAGCYERATAQSESKNPVSVPTMTTGATRGNFAVGT